MAKKIKRKIHGPQPSKIKREVITRTRLPLNNRGGKISVRIKSREDKKGQYSTSIHLPDTMSNAVLKFGKKNMHLTPTAKTRIGNKKILLYEIDERDHRVRRARELYYGVLEDLGGMDRVTVIQDMTAKLLSFLYVMAEEELVRWLKGADAGVVIIYLALVKVAGVQGKLLGLKRLKKKDQDDIPTNLDEYLAQQERKFKKARRIKPIIDSQAEEIKPRKGD